MRLAMFIGEQRLAMEQRMLNRLAVGLMAEGIQLTRIVPEGLPSALLGESERRMALMPRIEARMRSSLLTRSAHVRRVAEMLAEQPPDVLYLMGRDAWAFGLSLASILDRPAVLEVWSASQAAALPRPTLHANLAAATAPCEGIAKIVRARIGADLTALAPMGIPEVRRFRRVLNDNEHPPALAVLGGSRDVPAYAAMLNGLGRVLKDHPSLQVFLELNGPHEHDIWRLAERAGLMGAVSTIGSASQHHALLTRCDLVLWPESTGELRSVLLEAMAMAIPVVLAANPALDMLVNGSTALEVDPSTATGWADAVLGILADPEGARTLAERGRDHVLTHHRSSDHVDRLAELLQGLAGKESYAFPAPGV